MLKLLIETFSYGAASTLAFVVDFGLLTLLVRHGGWHYIAAASLSFIVGAVVQYFLCIKFVFRFRRIISRTMEMSYFVALGLVGLAINTLVILAAVEAFKLHYLAAKLTSASCTFAVNFLLRRNFLFSPAK